MGHIPAGLTVRARGQEQTGRERLTSGFQKFSIAQNFNKFENRQTLYPGLKKNMKLFLGIEVIKINTFNFFDRIQNLHRY
jgi:hypothetical protein